jgi:hypothetical protein
MKNQMRRNENENENDKNPQTPKLKAFEALITAQGICIMSRQPRLGNSKGQYIQFEKTRNNEKKRTIKPQNKHCTSGDSSPQSSGANLVPTKPLASAR